MENRIANEKSKLTAFETKRCMKRSSLKNFLLLHKQMVEAVPEIKEQYPAPKPRHIVEYFAKKNEALRGVATAELKTFKRLSAEFDSQIEKEKAGEAGEKKTFKVLETVERPYRILKNVELSYEDHVTEIDALVVTGAAVFIVEVKSSLKDVLIDEKGNFHKISKCGDAVLEKNIGVQMKEKEYVLRSVLKKNSIEKINIQSLLVFTNSDINVENKFPYIKECYLSDLPYIIENYEGIVQYQPKMLYKLYETLKDAHKEKAWSVDIDVDAYKTAFATLLVKIQVAEERRANRFDRKIVEAIGGFFKKAVKAAACLAWR